MMSRDEGNKYDPVSAQIAAESKIYVMILVIFVFFLPTISVSKVSLIYDDGITKHTSGKTGTTFDSYDPHFKNPIKMPAGWYLILYSTSKIGSAFKKILPIGTDLRSAMQQVSDANFDDPELSQKLAAFDQRCASVARATFNKIMKDNNSKIAADMVDHAKDVTKKSWYSPAVDWAKPLTGDDAYKISTDYPGNDFFTQFMWKKKYCTDTSDGSLASDPKTTSCIPNMDIELPNPECALDWKGLRTKLLDYYKDKKYDAFVINDSLIYTGIGESYNNNQAEKSVGNQSGGLFQKINEKILGFGSNIGGLFEEFFLSMIRFFLPITMGFITMLFIMFLPFLILFGRYQLSNIFPIGIAFFGVTMLPAIWHIPSWFDHQMIKAVYGSKGIVNGLFSLETAALDMLVVTGYVIVTYIWFVLLRQMGGGHMVSSLASGASSNSGAGLAQKGGRAAAKAPGQAASLGKGAMKVGGKAASAGRFMGSMRTHSRPR